MSLIGKGSSSFKKKDVQEQRSIALGFKKIRFAHKATLGATTINLTSLVAPTEMTSNGFTNPNATEIASANILTFRNNLKLISSLRGLLIDQLSYAVSSNTTITFLDFTAEDGEIFQGWLDDSPTTSLQVVDGKTIVASGILLAGQTDFNIGTPIPLNQNPAQQIGAVMVFADRGLQYRKVGNVTGGDGDYIEVPVAGGLGSLIRFNASGVDRFITVMSNGVVAERPDGSQTAFLERVQGQIDAMIPTLAAVAGVPETNFQAAPNDVDLKQFGDTVIDQQSQINLQAAALAALANGKLASSKKGTLQAIPDVTITPVTGWTVDSSMGGAQASDGQFTAPSDGLYIAFFQMSWAIGGVNVRVGRILLNGTDVSFTEAVASSSGPPSNTVIWAGAMSAGSILRPALWQNSGGVFNTTSNDNYNKWIVLRIGN